MFKKNHYGIQFRKKDQWLCKIINVDFYKLFIKITCPNDIQKSLKKK